MKSLLIITVREFAESALITRIMLAVGILAAIMTVPFIAWWVLAHLFTLMVTGLVALVETIAMPLIVLAISVAVIREL